MQLGLLSPLFLSVTLTVLLNSFVRSARGQQHGGSDRAEELYSQGISLAREGRLAEAESVLEKANTVDPANFDIVSTLGQVRGKLGDLPSAISLFQLAIQLAPTKAEAHDNLAIALADNNDLDAALIETTKSLALDPHFASAHLTKARILQDQRHSQESAREYAEVVKLAPEWEAGYYYWALLVRDEGDQAKETDLLRTVVRLQPTNEKALYLLGCGLSDQGDQPGAITSWKKALALQPNDTQTLYRLSRGLRESNPAESAELEKRFFRLRSERDNLDNIKSLGNDGYRAMEQQRWTDAIASFERALSMCEDCSVEAGLRKDLGLALCRRGDTPAGVAQLRAALKLNPSDRDIVKALSTLTATP